jgi:hypothetical protein
MGNSRPFKKGKVLANAPELLRCSVIVLSCSFLFPFCCLSRASLVSVSNTLRPRPCLSVCLSVSLCRVLNNNWTLGHFYFYNYCYFCCYIVIVIIPVINIVIVIVTLFLLLFNLCFYFCCNSYLNYYYYFNFYFYFYCYSVPIVIFILIHIVIIIRTVVPIVFVLTAQLLLLLF